jgi:hypothetical protein
MTTASTHGSSRTAVVSSATIASLSGTVLAADNALGFAGVHLFSAGVALFVVALAVLAATASVVLSVRARDLARGVGAASVLAFVLTLSPAIATALWLPLSLALQALVPLGFVTCAITTWQTSIAKPLRTWSAVVAVLAVAWGIGAYVPLCLEVFLALQVATLLAASVILGYPWIRRLAACLRHLWDSAEVR